MKPLYIGISGINAVDNPGPGIGIARSLKEDPDLEVIIVGLAYDTLEPGIYMDWLVDRVFLMPYPNADQAAYIARLADIKARFGLDLILPNLDAELPLYTKYRADIEALGIKTFLPSLDQFQLRGKDKLPEMAAKIGIKVPDTAVVSSVAQMQAACDEFGYPLMVKGPFYKAYKAHSMGDAHHYYHKMVAEWGYPIILQKLVYGEELNVVGVGDGEGGLLGAVGLKKTWITELGKIWTGVSIINDAMMDATRTFVAKTKWKGPFELECIISEGIINLIEINPRFPAWSYFATGLGLNLPSNIVRKCFGLPPGNMGDYEAGKLFIRYTYELVTDMAYFQSMTLKGER